MSKLVGVCVTLIVLASLVVLPVTASAENNPQLTEGGTSLATGANVVATNVGGTIFTDTSGNALIECTTLRIRGHVISNPPLVIAVTTFYWGGSGPWPAGEPEPECTGSFGNGSTTMVTNPICLRSTPTMATGELQMSGGNCPGGGNVKFIIGSTTIGECEYETAGAIKGDYKTNTSEMTVRNTAAGSGVKKIRGGFFCPSSMMLKMTFKLETENGTAVTIS